MNRPQKIALGVSALVIAGLVALAVAPLLTPASSAPTASATKTASVTQSPRLSEYERVTAEFDLPEGYSWPSEVPDRIFELRGTTDVTVYDITRYFWGCVTMKAAWDAVDAGDTAEADRILAALDDHVDMFDLSTFNWGDPEARRVGSSGMCRQALDAVDYPG